MARADLLLTLVQAATFGDSALLKKAVEALIAEERSKHHLVLADQLEKCLHQHPKSPTSEMAAGVSLQDLLIERKPRRQLSDFVLPESVIDQCRSVIEEHHRRELLRSFNLDPRNRMLLVGPPGNRKTSLAEALAAELSIPLYVLRYEGVIGSYLGETAGRLRRIFEFVRTRPCVFFIDEFDTLGKERGDAHETGEIKRVVSSLLLQIDDIPSHVLIVTATNHPELLDRAVWRRFQLKLELPLPNRLQIRTFISKLEAGFGFGLDFAKLDSLNGLSYAEIENHALDLARQRILRMTESEIRQLASDDMRQWNEQASIKMRH